VGDAARLVDGQLAPVAHAAAAPARLPATFCPTSPFGDAVERPTSLRVRIVRMGIAGTVDVVQRRRAAT
jgi:hypothetical protein